MQGFADWGRRSFVLSIYAKVRRNWSRCREISIHSMFDFVMLILVFRCLLSLQLVTLVKHPQSKFFSPVTVLMYINQMYVNACMHVNVC